MKIIRTRQRPFMVIVDVVLTVLAVSYTHLTLPTKA